MRRSEADSPEQLLFGNKNIFVTLIFRFYLYLGLLYFSFQDLNSTDSFISTSNEYTILHFCNAGKESTLINFWTGRDLTGSPTRFSLQCRNVLCSAADS